MASSTPVQIERAKKYRVNRVDEREDSRYCLLAAWGLDVEDIELEELKHRLLAVRSKRVGEGVVQTSYNLPGCSLKITDNYATARREREGECRVASFCLKAAFEESAVATESTGNTDIYKDIMATCDGFTSEEAAGNYCPRPGCGLSAGFSIDGPRGTSGDCLQELTQDELPLEYQQ